jgi:tetratricopeptide (TPR) repeat protein
MDKHKGESELKKDNNPRTVELFALTAILLTGLYLRGSYLSEIIKSPDFTTPMIDAAYHDYWARGLVSGDWPELEGMSAPEIPSTPYFRPPGYPCFLALMYLLSGSSFLAARIIQMGLGLANCVLAYILGRRLFGGVVGLLFAGFMAAYWVFILFEGELLAPVLLVFLGLCLMLTLETWTEKFTLARCLCGGVLLGLFAVIRPNILFFVPVVLVWGWWLRRRRDDARPLGIMMAGFLIGTVVVIIPVTIRNYIVANDFVPISSNMGINLYIGNNERTDCISPVIPDLPQLAGIDNWSCFDYSKIVYGVERRLGRKLKHSEVSSYFIGEANRYIRNNPGQSFKLLLKKALLFWGPAEVCADKEISCAKELSATLRYIPGFALPLSGAVVGLLLLAFDLKKRQGKKEVEDAKARKRLEMSLLIVFFIVVYFVSFLPFFIAARFRVPIIPFLFLFGAYGLYRIGRFIIKRDFRHGLCWLAIWIALYIHAAKHGVPYEPSWAKWYTVRGDAYRYKGQIDLAVVEYYKAIEADAKETQAHVCLGDVFARQNRLIDAASHYQLALDIEPDLLKPRRSLGNVFYELKEFDKAIALWTELLQIKPDWPEVLDDLGKVYYQQGKVVEAVQCWKRALQLRPDLDKIRNNLRSVALLQDQQEKIAHYTEVLHDNPDDPNAHNKLAGIFYAQGKIAEAISHWSHAVKLNPDSVDVHNNLALILATVEDEKVRNPDEAIRLAQRACEITDYKRPVTLTTLAIAYAAAGRFDEAIKTAEKAKELATASGQRKFAADIDEYLELYKRGHPYQKSE